MTFLIVTCIKTTNCSFHALTFNKAKVTLHSDQYEQQAASKECRTSGFLKTRNHELLSAFVQEAGNVGIPGLLCELERGNSVLVGKIGVGSVREQFGNDACGRR